MAAQALDRAEVLKKSLQQQKVVKPQQQQAQQQAIRPAFDLLHIDEAASAKSSSSPGKASVGHTDEEKKVLAVTSSINSREYLPFTSGDLREKFAFPVQVSHTLCSCLNYDENITFPISVDRQTWQTVSGPETI